MMPCIDWAACDPLESKQAGLSPYNYSYNNPVVWNDLNGQLPGGDDGVPAPKMADGTTATYTFTFHTYDYQGHVLEEKSLMLNSELGLPHGNYVFDKTLPRKKTTKDGYLEVVSLVTRNYSFTPYTNPAPPAENSSDLSFWDSYKATSPIQAGILNGAWNFASNTVTGLWHAVSHPVNTLEGIVTMTNALNMNSPFFYTPQSIAFRESALNALSWLQSYKTYRS